LVSRLAVPTVTRALGSTELTAAVRERLFGGAPAALWEDGEARVMVVADGLEAEIHEHGLIVSARLEADEAEGTVSVALALANGDEPPDLVAAAEERPRGEPRLAARWGQVLQDALFAVLVELLEDAAGAEDARPVGLRVREGALELAVAEPAEP
jgi:hypothetical protein